MKAKHLLFASLLGSSVIASAVTVVLPEKPTQQEKTAAQEISILLNKAYKSSVPVVSEKAPGKNSPYIYIGNTSFAAKNSIRSNTFAPEEHFVKVIDPQRIVVTGGNARGILYGSWEFLEKVYGILFLDDEFTYIPPSSLKQWQKGLTLQGKPAFEIRCIHTYWSGKSQLRQLKAIRNRQNYMHDQKVVSALKKYNLPLIYGSPRCCHTYYNYTKDWGKEDEVCFSMDKKGKRIRSGSASGPGQICWTNPRTAELFTKKLREFIKADQKKYGKPYPYLYVISDNDNGHKCHCPNCMAQAKKYKGYTGIVIEFTNRIARNIAKEYPYVIIQMAAYKDVYDVPEGIQLEPNVWINISAPRDSMRPLSHPNNKRAMEMLTKWSKMKRFSIWDWWILYPYFNTSAGLFYDAIPDCLRFYQKIGTKSMMVEFEYPMDNSFYALRLWLSQRFMFDPGKDLQKETALFMNAYYGPKAAPVMNELLNYIRKRQDAVKGCLNNMVPQQRSDQDEAYFKVTGRLIDKALSLAETPMQKKHIRKERFALDYCNIVRNRTKVGVDPKVFAARMREDFKLCAPLYMNAGLQKKNQHDLDILLTALTANIPQIKEIQGCKVCIDLPWPRLTEFRKSKILDMPDAAGGKAINMLDEGKYGGRLCMGFCNLTNLKKSKNIDLRGKNIPQDEKFHWYHIGKIELMANGYFWGHATWNIQIPSNQYYNPVYNPSGFNENEYELFMSAKVEGPNYVKGSKKKNSLSIDRIILARKVK